MGKIRLSDETKKWHKNDIEKFEKLCEPVVRCMQEHPEQFSIHSTIIITVDGAKLVEDEMFVPFELPEGY